MSEHAAGKPEKSLLGRAAGKVTNRVVETVDPDIILEHIDMNAVLDRIDINAILARVDIDALVKQVDLNALLATVDLETLVRRSGIPDIVAESTGQLAGSALDVARRQVVGLDFLIERVVDRLFKRDPQTRPTVPPGLAAQGLGGPHTSGAALTQGARP